MKVSIHQSQYWPWIPYIQKIVAADTFVYLDTVQFSKNLFQNRNQIKTNTGAVWITIPVRHDFGQSILEAGIADPRCFSKHFKTIATHYAKSEGFKRWKGELEELLLARTYSNLADIGIATTEWLLGKLSCTTRRMRASELAPVTGTKSKLVANLCKAVGADVYLAGSGALDYMVEQDFQEIGCEVWTQTISAFPYPQQYPQLGFVPHLSALDLLLNLPDEASALLGGHNQWSKLWGAHA